MAGSPAAAATRARNERLVDLRSLRSTLETLLVVRRAEATRISSFARAFPPGLSYGRLPIPKGGGG